MVINPIVGVYIPIIRIPIEGGMTIPNIAILIMAHMGDIGFMIPPPNSFRLSLRDEKKQRYNKNKLNLSDPLQDLDQSLIGSMYGIFTKNCLKVMVNVGKYTIHGSYGSHVINQLSVGLYF